MVYYTQVELIFFQTTLKITPVWSLNRGGGVLGKGSVQFSTVPWPIGSLGGHEGQFSRDPLQAFSAGGPCVQFRHEQGCPLFDDVHSAFSLQTMASPTLQGALKDRRGWHGMWHACTMQVSVFGQLPEEVPVDPQGSWRCLHLAIGLGLNADFSKEGSFNGNMKGKISEKVTLRKRWSSCHQVFHGATKLGTITQMPHVQNFDLFFRSAHDYCYGAKAHIWNSVKSLNSNLFFDKSLSNYTHSYGELKHILVTNQIWASQSPSATSRTSKDCGSHKKTLKNCFKKTCVILTYKGW